jgi:5-methylcytosine-specific restriction endonuclease McrA
MSTRPVRLRVCPKCARAMPLDHRCGEPRPARPAPPPDEAERIRRKRKRKRYDTAAWSKLSARAIARYGACHNCGRVNDLTAHLPPERGEDHARAQLRDVVVLCRSCHGKVDGRLGGGRR